MNEKGTAVRGMARATLAQALVTALGTADPSAKAAAARRIGADWQAGRLEFRFDVRPPERPARPSRPELRPPDEMPRRRPGSLEGRIALLHALAHIEFNAIDLALDILARFGSGMPRAFADDWLGIATQEAEHFLLVRERLTTFGTDYGDLPAHDGLWQAALATRDDLAMRLAVVPMVLEARGLDVTPAMRGRLAAAGDEDSARVLDRILADEIEHVAAGRRWFGYCAARAGRDACEYFRACVEKGFAGRVKPPFNHAARRRAGMSEDFYLPLARADRRRLPERQ